MIYEANLQNIHTLFGVNAPGGDFKFTIPAYQRPYRWSEQNLIDLLDDIKDHYTGLNFQFENIWNATQGAGDYLLGGIVLYVAQPDATNHRIYNIIDGQQRLTTITLICSALDKLISNLLENINEITMNQRLRYYVDIISPLRKVYRIDTPDDDANIPVNPRIKARERQSYINILGGNNHPIFNRNETITRYIANISCIKKYFEGDEWVGDGGLNYFRRLSLFAYFLVQKVSICVTSLTSHPGVPEDHRGALDIFLKINSRGQDLTNSDILKVELLSRLTGENDDIIANQWDVVFANHKQDKIDAFFRFIKVAIIN